MPRHYEEEDDPDEYDGPVDERDMTGQDEELIDGNPFEMYEDPTLDDPPKKEHE